MITQPTNLRKPIRSYPQISALAIRQGFSGPMRLYDLVQSLAVSRNGRPFFSRADLTSLDLLMAQQIDRALRDGLGLFWTRTPNGDYHMTSRAKVAVALKLEGKPGRAVWLPCEAFTGRMVNWKSATYAAYLAQLYRTTPSRDLLCEIFGVSIPTLLSWEHKTGIHVRRRIVMADPENLQGATGDQDQLAAVYDELEANATARTWITIRGPRGGIIAGRRLMTNENDELGDYWEVVEAPAWELKATPVLTWQTTNDYQSPLDVTPSGRGSWLHADIKRLGIPDTNAMGSPPDCGSDDDDDPDQWRTRPGWHDDPLKAYKWQGRKPNRSRPAVIQKVFNERITGEWLPSRAALWNEK